ncbi:MAG TPA: ankyrin repeat domain-containing protein [Gemmata sp.]|jgi:ankyrin repeat protein|nr:ankyrin repeat domain-containing protein [Gemmata sp.]
MAGKQPKRKDRPGVDRAGQTPLHCAALEGDSGHIRKLLASGLVADSPDDNGWTPLHFAAQSNAADATAVLLKAGAAVDARDAHGNTPLSMAVFNSRGNGEVIKLLRAHGADPNVKNNHGVSPLNLARTIANFDVRQFFQDLPEEADG